jgi:hypothetical protein
MNIVFDMGFWIQIDAATRFNDPDVGLCNALALTGTLTDTGPSAPALNDAWVWEKHPAVAGEEVWFKNVLPNWVNNTKYGSTYTSNYFRYIYMDEYVNHGGGIAGAAVSEWLIDYIGVYAHACVDEIRPISLAIDFETGRWLYMTTWEGEALYLRVYDTQVGLVHPQRIVKLGNCTQAELDARTYWAAVRTLYDPTVADYGERIIIHGRWDDGTVRHIFRSLDGGVTMVDIGDSATWGARWAGAAVWQSWDRILMCMNGAGDYLTGTSDGGTNWNDPTNTAIPFEVELAMSMHNSADGSNPIVIGIRAFGSGMQKQDSPYTGAWTNIDPGGAGTDVGAAHWVYSEIP